MSDPIRVAAGECTVRERAASETETETEAGEAREVRGRVVVVVKPDDTVLVHDADGYQPVAWLTRADGVSWESGDGFALTARKDERVLLVTGHDRETEVRYDATAAGLPVGDCRCGGPLVRADGGVHCLDCDRRYGLPRDATVLEAECDCGLPRFAAERGRRFELCLDRDCEASRSLDEAVREAFDGEWACPDCGAALRVIRRGGLMLGCERYPDCETGFAVPTGTVAGDCDCGLPAFETGSGRRCVDSTCDRPRTDADGSPPVATDDGME